MAKKIVAIIKLALPAGKATPAPPVGPALGKHGLNIMNFCKEYNARTADKGDLIIPGQYANPEAINFMAKYGRGLICFALPNSQVKKLNLSLMSSTNNARLKTAFTVSIDSKKGICYSYHLCSVPELSESFQPNYNSQV